MQSSAVTGTAAASNRPDGKLYVTIGCPGVGFFDFGAPTISEFRFETELPEYQIGNLRFGVRNERFDAAVFVNNLWDERAFLSIDRERGTRARVGYLTNQPRTYGVTARMNF